MISEIILTLIAIVGLILQFMAEHKRPNKEQKKKIGLYILSISILGLIISSIFKQIDSSKSTKDFHNMIVKLDSSKVTIDSLETKISLINSNNDSLVLINRILENLLNDANKNIADLKNETIKGFLKSMNKMETIGTASGARIISELDKQKMINILNKKKGFINLELTGQDQEMLQYAEQLKHIFRDAGWRTNIRYNYIMVSPPLRGLQIFIKDQKNFPEGIIEVTRALDVIGEFNNRTVYPVPDSRYLQEIIYIRVGYK